MTNHTILVTGGTGLIGRRLIPALLSRHYTIFLCTRNIQKARSVFQNAVIPIEWSGYQSLPSSFDISKVDVVIHLMGANVAGRRWTNKYKNEILDSRIQPVSHLYDAFHAIGKMPGQFISSSATGFYGDRGDEILTEYSNAGTGFLSDVCKQWEECTKPFLDSGSIVTNVRSGIVLDRQGGALPKLLLPYRFFVGGKLGSGNQWFNWIHWEDLVRIYTTVVQEKINGIVNAVAPEPVRMIELSKTLSDILYRPDLFVVPAFVLRIVLGETSFEILKSQRVIPKALSDIKFNFNYPTLHSALTNLIS